MTTVDLSRTLAAQAAAPTAARTAPPPPRLDLYAAIHKALRLAMSETLARAGSLDVADPTQRSEVLGQVRTLCAMCRAHLHKENIYVHPAIEASRPGASGRIAAEHEEHGVAIDAIEAEVAAVEADPSPLLAHRLYRHLARFVAENFEHMDVEESLHNALLWASYSDAELMKIHERILASIAPEEMAQVLHWMLPAISHGERAGMLGDMRAKAPPLVFDGVSQLARARLPGTEWAKLATALGL